MQAQHVSHGYTGTCMQQVVAIQKLNGMGLGLGGARLVLILQQNQLQE